MRHLRVHHIDAFTSHMFGGNPTVIVLDAEQLSEDDMRNLSREMSQLETAFLLPSERGDFRLRFFTRNGSELDFCGHAAVGALYAIEREREFGVENRTGYTFQVETNAGVVRMDIDLHHPEGNYFKFMAPQPDVETFPVAAVDVAKALGINPNLLVSDVPVGREKNRRHLFLTASSLEELGRLTIDFDQAIAFGQEHDVLLYSLVTPHAFDRKNHLHARAFAPSVGVYEDPFTGSMQAGLVAYALANNLVPADLDLVRSEQGHFLGRPGHCENHIVGRDPLQVHLHAEAVHVFNTKIDLI